MAIDPFAASEAEIARRVVAELQRQGFETFEEVSMGYGGKRADVVGLRGKMTVVVETKTTISLALLNQLCEWRGAATWVIGAVGRGRVGRAVERFCKAEGFGLWSVGKFEDSIQECVAPRFTRRCADGQIRKRCVAENRTGSGYAGAGTQAGGYFTPFRRTVKVLAEIVRAEPGITLRDALGKMDHHYASDKTARSSIPACIERGIVPGVRLERDAANKSPRLYPENVTDGKPKSTDASSEESTQAESSAGSATKAARRRRANRTGAGR